MKLVVELGRKINLPRRMRWLDGITEAMAIKLGKLLEMVGAQGGLACCSPWGHEESDMTRGLNNSRKIIRGRLVKSV